MISPKYSIGQRITNTSAFGDVVIIDILYSRKDDERFCYCVAQEGVDTFHPFYCVESELVNMMETLHE